jgi:hypothetical protein
MNPMDFAHAFRPDEWLANSTRYARTVLSEVEKQSERWTQYGLSQGTEVAGLWRGLQAQAFQISKSLIDSAEKTFGKAGT